MDDSVIALIGLAAAIGSAVGGVIVALIVNRSQWSRDKRARKRVKVRARLRSICPHGEIVVKDDQIMVEPWWWKVPGQFIYTCRICGAHNDQRGAENSARIIAGVHTRRAIKRLKRDILRAYSLRRKLDYLADE